jgi:hypothetical protein
MSKIVRVSQGDYRLIVQSGGYITLDTGSSIGTVVITGNLDVKGITTTIESVNTTIADNIVKINEGQTGNGIGAALGYQAGIQISRGTNQTTYPDAQFIFDESIQHYDALTSTNKPGSFVFRKFNTTTGLSAGLTGIQVSSISTSSAGDLVFDLQSSIRKLRVVNTTNYESRITQDNDIPNRKFITDYVQAGSNTPGIADVDKIYRNIGGVEKARVQTYDGYVQFAINQSVRSQITPSGLDVDNVNLFANTVTNKSAGNNLIITALNNNVELNAILNLDVQSSHVTSASSSTVKIYSRAAEGSGRTGIYFTTNNPYGSASYNNDELVSKNRAVLLSILL